MLEQNVNDNSSTIALAGRRVIVGISGGIAAYKSAELVRALRKAGAEVRVVMTAGAQEFITPLTLQALSGQPVATDLLDPAAEAAMGHIELARWAELVLVAPASANFLARLAQGRADDLLTTLCLATRAPLMLAPAMNNVMWQALATQTNIDTLRQRGIALLGPAAGEQACGETGLGRMLEPFELAAAVARHFHQGPLAGVRLLLTAGPTREAIDPVRFISNRSSGKMGYAVAAEAAKAGAQVVLVSGPVCLECPPGVQRVMVESAAEMYAAVMAEACDLFVATAAVADYRPAQTQSSKIKKDQAALSIALERTDDILAAVAARGVFSVGFAAETDQLAAYARDKLQRKGLAMIAANWVGDGRAFDQAQNALEVFWGDDGHHSIELADKAVVAHQLIQLIAERYHAQHPSKDS